METVKREPRVVIVGRPNVGKSTLYNRIIHRRDAIVDQRAGVTRDRQEARTQWQDRSFIIIDTGGYETDSPDDLADQIQLQLNLAIDKADVIVFLVDAKDGLTPVDVQMASLLRRTNKPIILAINKIDAPQHYNRVYDFYSLGLASFIPISAEHNENISELLDRIIELFPQGMPEEVTLEPTIKIAIIGRPNVGKSSLINKLLREERVIVHEIPGTTRDAVDSILEMGNDRYLLTDTAGIRRKAKVKDKIDKVSMLQTLKRIKRSHISVVLLDAMEGVSEQDARIAGYVHEAGRAIILGVNKWDLMKDKDDNEALFIQHIRQKMPFIHYAPICFLSAITGEGLEGMFRLIKKVFREYSKKVPTPKLNTLFQDVTQRHPPPLHKHKPIKFYYLTQIMTAPPSFLCFVNHPQAIPPSYQRFLLNQLRETFGFQGTPIRLIFRPRKPSKNKSPKSG
jgi:GTP-binding protein